MAGIYITGNCQNIVGCNQSMNFDRYNAGEEFGYESVLIVGQQINGESISAISSEYGQTILVMDTIDGTFDSISALNITVSFNNGENELIMSFDSNNLRYSTYMSSSFLYDYYTTGEDVLVCITTGGSLPG